MLYEQKLSGSIINWPNPLHKKTAVIAIPPDVPAIKEILARNECTCKQGANCYEVVNKFGDAIELPYTATLQDWEEAAVQLKAHRG